MSRYFQLTTDHETKLPVSLTAISSSTARNLADKGPGWFILRTGVDEPNPVGFHACDLNSNQQAQLEAFRLATPGCPLPADWNDDYPTEEAAAQRRFASGGYDVPLSRGPVQQEAVSSAGEYIKAL